MVAIAPNSPLRVKSPSSSASRQALRSEISFIYSPEFLSLTESLLDRSRPAVLHLDTPGDDSGPLPATSLAPRNTPLLTPEGERFLFKSMNFLRFRANQLRSGLGGEGSDARRLKTIHRLLERAEQARAQLVQSNLRLVASIAHRMAGRHEDYEELMAEGCLILLKAIDKFDYRRGFRFSTYATHAVQRHLVRMLKRRHKIHVREIPCESDQLVNAVPAPAAAPTANLAAARELLSHFGDCLDDRERMILEERFGLVEGDGPPAAEKTDTLKSVAAKVGLSKERVRQLQIRALEKLQDLAIRLNLRPELEFPAS